MTRGGGAEGLIKATKHETVDRPTEQEGTLNESNVCSALEWARQGAGVKGHRPPSRRTGGVADRLERSAPVLRCFGGVIVGEERVKSVMQ